MPMKRPHPTFFFALWPSDSERSQLASWQAPLQKLCAGRAIRNDALHLTLSYLGCLEPARLEALQQAASRVLAAPFELDLDQARCWPRLVYAAPSQIPPKLLRLVTELGSSLAAQQFLFDSRAYLPHVTLLRCAQAATLPAMGAVNWTIRDFALVQSENGVYRVLARFPLGMRA